MRHRNGPVAVATAVIALLVIPAVARAEGPACSAGPATTGGDWTTYGADLDNSRTQASESGIGVAEANTLAPAFVYEAPGAINNTPIVADGCVYVTSTASGTSGHVAALDAESGEERWAVTIPTGPPSFGGPMVGSPAVFEDLLLVPVNKNAGPFVVALDRHTGDEAWRTTLDDQPDSGTNAGVVVHDGVAFAGFFGHADSGSHERGGFVLLEAATGEVLAKTYSIPDDDFEEGYDGAGIWATPAIDTSTGLAYVGTSNPHNPQRIHPRSGAILKVDLNRDSATFGQILDHYEGVRDTVVPGAEQQPVCDAKPDVYYAYSFSVTCLAIDLDFGSSPNLIRPGDGRTLIGNLQKAGIYHVVDTETMDGVSMTPVGPPCFACNAASTAYADGRAFVPAGPPGQMVAVDIATGAPAWTGHLTGALTYNAPSAADGLVWTIDSGGFLDAFDQLTGAQVVKRPLQLDTGTAMTSITSSAGIAIARETLYVAATNFVIAYRGA